MLKTAVVAAALAAVAGCAQINPVRDTSGKVVSVESTKFMADLAYKITVTEELGADGKVTRRTMSEEYETRTNADRILDSATKMLGQAVDGASKIMP